MDSSLVTALAAGTTAVTPNNRLARRLVAQYDLAQRAAGHKVWPAARILPWSLWLDALWLDALAEDALPTEASRLAPTQSMHLWRRILAADIAPGAPFVDIEGTALLAADAWALVHAWGADGESWRGWRDAFKEGEDQAAFARWAERYSVALEQTPALDAARLADALAGSALRVSAWRSLSIAWIGFLECSPQQERLLNGLEGAGARIARPDVLLALPGSVHRVEAATPHDELAQALTWARNHALKHPGSIIGIALDDLAARRTEVIALAEDIVCPGLQAPGQEGAQRPYDVSLGASLADLPLVAAAIDLIALGQGPLPTGRASSLLRSPYLLGAEARWLHRASVERDWLEQGRNEVTLNDAIAALSDVDPELAALWRAARGKLPRTNRAAPREWVDLWRSWLDAAGWPGNRALTSVEAQARAAWDEILGEFAALGAIEGLLPRGEAMAALRALAGARVFQPEAPPAPIQILGLLESAGLPCDALWVTGLAAERWPRPAQPNPLLSLAWQRERNVLRSSAARELAYGRALTAQLMRGAPSVVMSHARVVDERSCVASTLIADLPELDGGAITVQPGFARTLFDVSPPRARCLDDRAPALAAALRVRGGSGLIEAQSDCPFKSAALYRLEAQPWPETPVGLSTLERGKLVHAALAGFWREVRNQATLAALAAEDLERHIASAATLALAELAPTRRALLPAIVVDGEAARIARLLRQWIDEYERTRPPFTVQSVELALPCQLPALTIGVRLDRVDALADGGVAIIDYKTGGATSPIKWFESRPQAPQLALYALALRAAATDQQVRALAYAQLKPGEPRVQGLAADALAWPRLMLPEALADPALADWKAVEAWWSTAMSSLAEEHASGRAAVMPRDFRQTCRRCHLQPMCRIGAQSLDPEGDGDV